MLIFWLLSVFSSNDLWLCVLSTIHSVDVNYDDFKISDSSVASLMITTCYFSQMLLL